jgi:tetratricopeptide (TPR) repeat protein
MNARVLLIEARKNLEAAVKLRPDHPRYLELLGSACLISGDTLAAIQHFEHAMRQEPSVRTTWLHAWALVHAGRIADVERIVRELIESGRGCARALYVRSLARFKRKAFDLAIEDLREAMPDEVDVPFFRIELGRLLIAAALGSGSGGFSKTTAASGPRTQMLREATDLLRSSHVDDPGSVEQRNYLTGCAYLELGEWTRALSVLAETDYPSHAEASFRRGLAAAREGDSDTAANCFESATSDLDLAPAANACIRALRNAGNLQGVMIPAPAIAPLGVGPPGEPAIVRLIIPGDGWPSGTHGPRAALQPSPAAPALAPSREPSVSVVRLSDALAAEDIDFAAASDCVAALEAGTPMPPKLANQMLHALATALYVDLRTPQADVAEIVPLLERLRRARPKMAFPRLYLARACYRVRDYARAIDELVAIEGPLSNQPVIYNILGRCHEKLGHLQEATHAFEDSIARRPGNGTIHFSLGRILLARYRRACAEKTTRSLV